MLKLMASIQIIVILLIVGYGTYSLFRGDFEVTFATLPLLIAYYVLMIGRAKRKQLRSEED